MSNILLKSKIDLVYRSVWVLLLLSSPLLLIAPIYYFFKMYNPLNIYGIVSLRNLAIFSLINFFCLIWLGLQFYGSYIIVYDTGFKIRTPFGFFRYTFISWNSIKEIDLKTVGKKGIRGDYKERDAIFISLRNSSKKIAINEIWVSRIGSVYRLMKKYIVED